MIKQFFAQVVESITASVDNTPADREAALRLATAVLMIDVARADHVFEESEFDRVLRLAQLHFDLTAEQAAELVNEADAKAEELVSAYEFTEVLHRHLSEDEKAQIVGLLWDIAYADGELDKYEDALILKISDLLYVSRARVMRLKYDAAESCGKSVQTGMSSGP
jgi:uncharacterized tellurite resistance protein B-like protein